MWPGATEGRSAEPWAYVRRLLPLCFTRSSYRQTRSSDTKVPVCSAGVRGFAVFFILLDFFSFYKAKKTGTWRAKGSGQIGVLPVRVYISFIHLDAFRCPADLAAWVIMGDGRCLESKA